MAIISGFTIERFHEIQNKYEAMSVARKASAKYSLIGKAMNKIKPDAAQQYDAYKAEYYMMLPQIKARAEEIAKDFCMITEGSIIDEVAAVKSLEGKLYVRALFKTNREGAALESAELKPEWFCSDDYKEQAAVERAKNEAREYEEYLRLKKKFEPENN
jgi:hypothetical protein